MSAQHRPLCIIRDIDTLNQLRKQLQLLPGILPVRDENGDKIQLEIYMGDNRSILKITKCKLDLTTDKDAWRKA